MLRRARPDRLVLRTLQFRAPEFFFPPSREPPGAGSGAIVFLTEAFISLDIHCVSLTFPLAYQYLAPQDIYMFSDLI